MDRLRGLRSEPSLPHIRRNCGFTWIDHSPRPGNKWIEMMCTAFVYVNLFVAKEFQNWRLLVLSDFLAHRGRVPNVGS